MSPSRRRNSHMLLESPALCQVLGLEGRPGSNSCIRFASFGSSGQCAPMVRQCPRNRVGGRYIYRSVRIGVYLGWQRQFSLRSVGKGSRQEQHLVRAKEGAVTSHQKWPSRKSSPPTAFAGVDPTPGVWPPHLQACQTWRGLFCGQPR
jgi:hypothetical protein